MITLKVNGEQHDLDIEGEMPLLLYTLRLRCFALAS